MEASSTLVVLEIIQSRELLYTLTLSGFDGTNKTELLLTKEL